MKWFFRKERIYFFFENMISWWSADGPQFIGKHSLDSDSHMSRVTNGISPISPKAPSRPNPRTDNCPLGLAKSECQEKLVYVLSLMLSRCLQCFAFGDIKNEKHFESGRWAEFWSLKSRFKIIIIFLKSIERFWSCRGLKFLNCRCFWN